VADTFGSNIAHVIAEEESDTDRIPDTCYTVWESSVLLGMYGSRTDVWERLIGRRELRSPSTRSRPITILELGSGTGVASLLVATSEVVREKRINQRYQMIMTDLPSAINFTRLNVHVNIDNIPSNVSVVTEPLRWGRIEDIHALLSHYEIDRPDIIFGADLLYTCEKTVINALAETVAMLTPRVAVFAVCKQHRPESIDYFISLVQSNFEIRRVSASSVHIDLLASDEDFALLEMWRKKKIKDDCR
jgi:hypothetical protein